MTTVRDQIHALRWRAAADALDIDPSADPNIAGLAELREAKTARQRLADECHRVADSATQTAAELAEIQDLLSERMALLDAERPGATIIDLLKGMLEATKQREPREWAAEFTEATIREFAPFMPSGYMLHRRPGVGWVWQTGETSGAAWPTPQGALAEAWRGAAESIRALCIEALPYPGRSSTPTLDLAKEVCDDLVAARKQRDKVRGTLAAIVCDHHGMTLERVAETAAVECTNARTEAAHQRDRAARANGDIEDIAAAYYAAGFGPSPTNAKAIASALEKARSRGAALRALGWDGAGCPEAWAKNCKRVYDGSKPVSLHPVMLELLAPLRIAIGAMGSNVPKRIVELAVQRIEADARDAARQAALHEAHRQNLAELRTLIAGHETADSAQVLRGAIDVITGLREEVKTIAAHRWRASDLQAVLSHERHLRTEADNALVESTRPIWPLLGGRFIGSVDGITRRMVQVLQEQHKSLTHNGSIAEFDGPDE